MIRVTIIFIGLLYSGLVIAQPERRVTADKQVMMLKNGVLVVRLKTNDKSIAGYRSAGKEKLAKKLELENELMNLDLMQSFLDNFNFCKLLFIKAVDTKGLLVHEPGIFLDETLKADPAINFSGDSFFIAEYGEAVSNMKSSDYNYNGGKMQESQNPASTSALVIMDTTLNQLEDPFPYYSVVNISITNFWKKHPINNPKKPDDKRTPYDLAVRLLNQRLIKYYSEACLRHGITANPDKGWWDSNNPNKNTDAITDKMRKEENAVIDERNALKGN